MAAGPGSWADRALQAPQPLPRGRGWASCYPCLPPSLPGFPQNLEGLGVSQNSGCWLPLPRGSPEGPRVPGSPEAICFPIWILADPGAPRLGSHLPGSPSPHPCHDWPLWDAPQQLGRGGGGPSAGLSPSHLPSPPPPPSLLPVLSFPSFLFLFPLATYHSVSPAGSHSSTHTYSLAPTEYRPVRILHGHKQDRQRLRLLVAGVELAF